MENCYKKGMIIISIKRHRKGILLLICLSTLAILLFECYHQAQSHNHNKFGSIDKDHITSFKIMNIMGQEKEIKNKSDRDRLIDLINSVKVTKSDVELRYGIGFGVILKYSNGEKFSANFLATTMVYSTNDNKATWCEVDKNLVDILRATYDETKVKGIDNNERKIKEIVPIKYADVTKIIFTGNAGKTLENKEDIAKIMSLIDQYTIKQVPKEFPSDGHNISAKFFIGSKEVMNIDFINPIRINGKSYEYKNKQLGNKTINDFLNSISL